MAYVTGLVVIDAPASALNNAGAEEGSRTDNTIGVKKVRTKSGDYPYVSAQAMRYWLRELLERNGNEWQTAPVFRESKIAYTDANPIKYWDDDLFGYMRAQSKKKDAKGEQSQEGFTPTSTELTRVSPFRVGTLISLGPVNIVNDFGTMSRHDGDPVPHEHQFYRATLQGPFSINLSSAGSFFVGGNVGYRNLDDNRIEEAKKGGLTEETVSGHRAWRLSFEQRSQRVAALVKAIGELEGGAKLTLHYTDVTPPLVFAAITKSGNHPFIRVLRANHKGNPEVAIEALQEICHVYKDDFLSDVYVGWAKGYLDNERKSVEALTSEELSGVKIEWGHPRTVMETLSKLLRDKKNEHWYA